MTLEKLDNQTLFPSINQTAENGHHIHTTNVFRASLTHKQCLFFPILLVFFFLGRGYCTLLEIN